MKSDNHGLPPRYTNVQHLARGGMGDVYRAMDTVLGRTVAIKVLSERFGDDEDVKRRFKNEGLAAARLSGAPSTVTIFDVGEDGGSPYIVMEYLEGGSLEQRLRQGRPDPADALRWLEQAAAGLDAGHAAGVVHRDVKPGNLLLDSRDEIHVADFGVASAVGLDSMTMTGMVLGTAGYLSPEQAQGQRATPESDRYALGVVAWELLTGKRPYESESPTAEATSHVNAPIPSISPQLDPVFQRALAKDPKERYPSAAVFVSDLRRAFEPEPTEETVAVASAGPPPRRRPNLLVPALLVGALLLLGGGIAVAGMLNDDEQQAAPRTVVSEVTVTEEGRTLTTSVTMTAPSPPPPPPPPPTPTPTPPPATPPPPAASGRSGQQLTDDATALLRQGRWTEAEAVARQAVQKLNGTGELYEAYAKYNLGRALVEQGRCDEALPLLNESERIQGSRSQIREARARCE